MRLVIVLSVLLMSFSATARWYKGNTHTHTKLSGHGDTSPLEVAKWYHTRGYNFLVLSEHNRFINPAKIKIKNQRKDFLLIPGVEVTGKKHIHTTALNVKKVIPFGLDSLHKKEIIESHVKGVLKAGGEPILNHPNWQYALTFDDIAPVEKLGMFELFNGHPHVNNFGDKGHQSTEQLWDKLLTSGKKIFAVSADDAHYFSLLGPKESNPGRGWVMVQSDSLTPDAIVAAMRRGDFYSCNGVYLKSLKLKNGKISIVVDKEKSLTEIKIGRLVGKKAIAGARVGLQIQFIGANGILLETEPGERAVYKIDKKDQYVRVKVIYRVKTKNGVREFYAWTQPVFSHL